MAVLQNGAEVKTLSLSESTKWHAATDKLPKLDEHGNLYKYAIEEKEVAGYKLTDQTWVQKEEQENAWVGTLTNTKTTPPGPNPPTPEPPDPNNPDGPEDPKRLAGTGDPISAIPLIALGLAALAGGVALLVSVRRRPRSK